MFNPSETTQLGLDWVALYEMNLTYHNMGIL